MLFLTYPSLRFFSLSLSPDKGASLTSTHSFHSIPITHSLSLSLWNPKMFMFVAAASAVPLPVPFQLNASIMFVPMHLKYAFVYSTLGDMYVYVCLFIQTRSTWLFRKFLHVAIHCTLTIRIIVAVYLYCLGPFYYLFVAFKSIACCVWPVQIKLIVNVCTLSTLFDIHFFTVQSTVCCWCCFFFFCLIVYVAIDNKEKQSQKRQLHDLIATVTLKKWREKSISMKNAMNNVLDC